MATVNEKMTAIADAIRAKTGGTDALTLDGMAQAIAGIEVGGGDGLQVRCGIITLAETSRNVRIEHDLGKKPVFYMVAILPEGSNNFDSAPNGLQMVAFSEYFLNDNTRNKNTGVYVTKTSANLTILWNVYGTSYASNSFGFADDTYIAIGSKGLNEIYEMQAGASYFYLLMG